MKSSKRISVLFALMLVSCASSQDEILKLEGAQNLNQVDEKVDGETDNGIENDLEQSKSPEEEKLKTINSKYPFPERINIFSLTSFFKTYAGVYQKFQPINTEYGLYFSTLNQGDAARDQAMQTVKMRVRETPEKAHWVFFYALKDLLLFLQDNSRTMLHVDLEENFASRMRAIIPLSKELSEALGDNRYFVVAKNLYISLNERYFDRVVKSRDNSR